MEDLRKSIENYLEFCRYRKELDGDTLRAYKTDLNQFSEACSGAFPEKGKIEEYITSLHQKYKQKTVKRKTASLGVFYAYLLEMGIISENPLRNIHFSFKEESIMPRIIPRKEIEVLLNRMYGTLRTAGDKRKEVLRDIVAVETLFATGARVSEVSGITPDAIDLRTGTIRFMGKGRKERFVRIMDKDVLHLLNEYSRLFRIPIKQTGYFFINGSGRQLKDYSIRRILRRYTKKAGISRRITPHMFRHSVATYLIEEDVDISLVKNILGHASLRTTEIYLHVSVNKQSQALKSHHPRRKMRITV